MDSYLLTFSDVHGSEATTIANDGTTLRTVIRGVEFSGTDFDALQPAAGTPPEKLEGFVLQRNSLCSCRIETQILIPVQDMNQQSQGFLLVALTLGDPAPNGGVDRETLHLFLNYRGEQFAGTGQSGWFEDELTEIQSQLPEGVFMKACINCLYSDYSPYGHGSFGCMMCFRNLKSEYLRVKSKDDLWSIHDRHDRMVQETYLCPEFERRVPDTGYRG